MGFPRQKYWTVLPFPPPGHLPHPEMDPLSLISSALAGEFFTTSTTSAIGKPQCVYIDAILSHVKLEYPPH